MTPNQIRDWLFENSGRLTTEKIRMILAWIRTCADARKMDSETYLRCPRCYGFHSIHGNFDNLCDGCQYTVLKHFPQHESVSSNRMRGGRNTAA